jgi:hypothetical protein
VPAELKVWVADPPWLRVGVLKLPSLAVALCGAWPVLRQVIVSPVWIVTAPGLKKKSPIVTLMDEAFRAFAPDAADARVAGAAAGTPAEPPSIGWRTADPPLDGDSPPPDGPAGGASGAVVVPRGSVGSGVVVVVLVAAGVPESCAADTAGTAQIAARTSIPLARALAPFITGILRSIDS